MARNVPRDAPNPAGAGGAPSQRYAFQPRGRRDAADDDVPSRIVVEVRHDDRGDGRRRRDRSPSPLTIAGGVSLLPYDLQQQQRRGEEAEGLGPPPPKRVAVATKTTSVVDPVKREVQELLEKKLMGMGSDGVDDDRDKLKALRTLAGYFDNAEPNDGKVDHRRWVAELQGCCLVLMVLRQQLDKQSAAEADAAAGVASPRRPANRQVVRRALRFLRDCNIHSDQCRDDMSTFDGVGTVVRAQKIFFNDVSVLRAAIHSLLAFLGVVQFGGPAHIRVTRNAGGGGDDGGPMERRRRELVKAGAIVPAYRALVASLGCEHDSLKESAIYLLEHLCDDANPDDVRSLKDAGAVSVFANLWDQVNQKQTLLQQPPSSPNVLFNEEVVLATCRKWIIKLTS